MNLREAKLRQKFFKMIAAATLVMLMSVQAAFGQAAAQKTWKDGEYDLANPAMSDTNMQTKLQKLDAWKAKFPTTDFDAERRQHYLATYQALNKPADVFAISKEMLAKDPDNLAALTALVIFIYRFQPAPATADMATADQAASSLLTNADKYFASDKKPQGVTDDQWAASKKEILGYAQTCLAWTATQRKEWEKAENEYTKVLQMQPTNLQATYQLATVILNQKKVEKLPFAIFHLGRAANYSGAGALDEKARKSIQVYYEKQYANYHGDKSDLDKVTAAAVANVFPPDGFHIKSLVEIDEEKRKADEEAAKNDPAGAMWKTLRDALVADGGQAYFDGSIKGAGLPGGANGVNKFKGKLVSATPETNPKELVLGITDPKVGEVTLKLDAPLRGKMDVGTEIGFEGVATAFTKDPFMLNFDVEKAKIVGWTAAPAPVRKAVPRPPVKK
jgi:tetratricopeptide (TPR) repeat protein